LQLTAQEATVRRNDGLVHLAAFGVRTERRLVVHEVRPEVARLVAHTDLHSLPGEPPRLLRGPLLFEVHRPETGNRLFGDTVALPATRTRGSSSSSASSPAGVPLRPEPSRACALELGPERRPNDLMDLMD
jgi:hypothetical protein